ncbi:hypothetical protein [Ochrobactrum sp. S1502_03]|uniref:hypothetical protein n=1 Tax=Ochrobactrum sp. S1502_03 TaxID=3108451 RepID=UPI0037CADC62
MPITSAETQLAKETILAAIFKEAFIEASVSFGRRDTKAFDILLRQLRDLADRIPARKLVETAALQAGATDVEELRKGAIRDAAFALNEAFQVAAKRVHRRL